MTPKLEVVRGDAARNVDRFLAAAVDLTLIAALTFAVSMPLSRVVHEDVLGYPLYLVFAPVVGAAYAAAFRLARRATPGKLRMRIEVVEADGRPVGIPKLIVREGLLKWLIFGAVSIFSLGLPFLVNTAVALIAKDHRALHDRLAGTRVVDTSGRRS